MNREDFERSYASSHDLPLETFSQYRMGDTYRLPGIASHWRTWCSALESVVITLPVLNPEMFGCNVVFGHEKARTEAEKAIEAAGLKVAK